MASDVDLFNLIDKEVNKAILFDDSRLAKSLIGDLNILIERKKYQEKQQDLYLKILNYLIRLKWIALPLLKPEDAYSLFGKSFNQIFELEDYDLWNKIKFFLMGSEVLHEDRDTIKQNIKNILIKNQEIITSKKINLNQSPTIENWLKVYVGGIGNQRVDPIKLSQFYIDNKDYNNLGINEKKKIKTLFDFYEKLKNSSLTAAGIEESVPVNTKNFEGIIRDGKFIRKERLDYKTERLFEIVNAVLSGNEVKLGQTLSPEKEKKLKELEEIAEQFAPGTLERRAVEEEIRKLGN